MTRPWLLVLLSAAALGTTSACGNNNDDSGDGDIRIGLVAPRGDDAYQSLTGAILLAQKLLNDAGGLFDGRGIRFSEFDESTLVTDVDQATAACQSVIDRDIKVMIGPFASAAALACAPLTGAAGVLQMSPVSTADQLSNVADNDFTFRVAARSGYTAGAAAQYLYAQEGARKAGVLAANNTNSQSEAAGFAAAFRAAGGSVTVESYTFDPATFDARAHLNAVFADAPDVIYLTGLPSDAVALLEAWDKSAFTGKWILGSGLLSNDVATNVGASKVQGIRIAVQHASMFDTLLDLSAAYEALNGFSIQQYNAGFNIATFEATLMVLLAIQRAGTASDAVLVRDALREVGAPPGEVFTWQSFGGAMQTLREGGDVDFDGLTSDMRFDANGDVATDVDLFVFTPTLLPERTLVAGVDFTP